MVVAQSTLDRADALIQWYERGLRRFLQEQLSTELISQFDNECTRLDKARSQDRRALVCFVGESGIGKSTLINAVVAEDKIVVPSGGVGPLTALATEVDYNEIRRFRAEYHPRAHFWRFAAVLRFHAARLQKQEAEIPPLDDPSENVREELQQEISQIAEAEGEGGPSRVDEFISTAKLLIAGDQFADRSVAYLADALALAYSIKSQWGTVPLPEDAMRIDRIKEALKLANDGHSLTIEEAQDQKAAFRDILRDHAAGFLSPLIRRIEVGWPSRLLENGLVLVDLPGVGIAGDVYRKETQQFVRERARAVVLVTKRGLAVSVMQLLKDAGYWNRLLLSSDDPSADPCSLILAVTHVDAIADEEWRNQDQDAEGRRPRSKQQVFAEVCEKLRSSQKLQLEAQLKVLLAETGDASRAAAESAARTLLDSLQVHPVSAVQYRLIASENEEDRPFLRSLDQTGVPAFSDSLLAVAEDLTRRQIQNVVKLTRRFAEGLWSQLGLIETSLRRTDRATEEAKRIRSILEAALKDKNEEYKLRRASFRNYLKETVPEKIKSGVLEARIEAEADVRRYLRRLQEVHWATLCATVRKGGTHVGKRRVDLPEDIAQMFLDPVASVWSQKLLKDIRQQTYKLAADIRTIVEELCDEMAKHAELVDEGFVQAQKKLVSNQVEQLRDVGKEAIEELREVVKVQIVKSIEKPIRNACMKFVQEGKNRDIGVKARILDLFQDLATRATEGASIPTEKALLSRYETVEAEIRSAFDTWGNPLKQTVEAIAKSHEAQTRDSDSEREHKLAEIQRIRGEAPEGIEEFAECLSVVTIVPSKEETGAASAC